MDTSAFEGESHSVPAANHSYNERLQILQMIEDGKLTPEQGMNLLSALASTPERERGSFPATGKAPNWFRVRVTDLATGKSRASVSIPLRLMDWGLKIGAQFAPEVSDVDLSQLGEVLRSGVGGKIIDVIDDEDGEHVEIFVE